MHLFWSCASYLLLLSLVGYEYFWCYSWYDKRFPLCDETPRILTHRPAMQRFLQWVFLDALCTRFSCDREQLGPLVHKASGPLHRRRQRTEPHGSLFCGRSLLPLHTRDELREIVGLITVSPAATTLLLPSRVPRCRSRSRSRKQSHFTCRVAPTPSPDRGRW